MSKNRTVKIAKPTNPHHRDPNRVPVDVFMRPHDQYLDMKYYVVSYFFNGILQYEKILKCVYPGEIILTVMNDADSTGQEIDFKFNIEKDPDLLGLFSVVTGQGTSKNSLAQNSLWLCGDTALVKRMRELVSHHSVQVVAY